MHIYVCRKFYYHDYMGHYGNKESPDPLSYLECFIPGDKYGGPDYLWFCIFILLFYWNKSNRKIIEDKKCIGTFQM